MTALLSIVGLRIDVSLQNRAKMDADTIGEYAEAITAGAEFPPITVFTDGKLQWVVDGFHRVAAYQTLGLDTIAADIRKGSHRDALKFSLGVNDKHGLKRSTADKRYSVMKALADPEWKTWNNVAIADLCAVSDMMVHNYRPPSVSSNGLMIEDKRKVERNGTTYLMDTSNIGGGKSSTPKVSSDAPTPAYVSRFSPCPTCAAEFVRLVSLLDANGITH